MNYNILTPLKNEERYILQTIESVLSQNKLPQEWLIIDDFSTDNSLSIIKKYANQYGFISVIESPKINQNEISARIAYLVNYGCSKFKEPFDLFLKLDADVILPIDYCSDLLSKFEENNKLGIASGCAKYKGIEEKNNDKNLTRGAAKFYRRDCFQQIGGAYISRGWDTMDNYAAHLSGWETKKFDIYFNHIKKEGKKSGKIMLRYWTGLFNGRVPYYFPYFLLKILRYIFHEPIVIGSLIELFGYINSRYIANYRPFPIKLSKYVISIQKNKIFNTLSRLTNVRN